MGFQKIICFRNAKSFQIGVNFSFFSVYFGRLSAAHFAFAGKILTWLMPLGQFFLF
jgi:hypothetical protein